MWDGFITIATHVGWLHYEMRDCIKVNWNRSRDAMQCSVVSNNGKEERRGGVVDAVEDAIHDVR